jgi:hypothetical protein
MRFGSAKFFGEMFGYVSVKFGTITKSECTQEQHQSLTWPVEKPVDAVSAF